MNEYRQLIISTYCALIKKIYIKIVLRKRKYYLILSYNHNLDIVHLFGCFVKENQIIEPIGDTKKH